MLREWKTQAEQSSFRAILSGQNSSVEAGQKPSSDSSIEPLLQRIRGAAVADLAGFKRAPSWPRQPLPTVSASIGVATTPPEERSRDVYLIADRRQGVAKQSGKNQVVAI
jgi:GGDEF domain-containing protein